MQFEGQTYPTASCVIPFLDQVFSELDILVQKLPVNDKPFPRGLLQVMKSSKRFPNGYKTTAPFNFLTLLDVRHMDIYFTPEETNQAVDVIFNDPVFDNVIVEEASVMAAPALSSRYSLNCWPRFTGSSAPSQLPAPPVRESTISRDSWSQSLGRIWIRTGQPI